MGLIANYSCLSDVNLKELKAMGSEEEEILESVEEWNDDDELLLDIDKMWDVLHFVLTGLLVKTQSFTQIFGTMMRRRKKSKMRFSTISSR